VRRRLRDERGTALIVAVAALAAIGTMSVSLLAYTSSSARDASLKQAGQSAYALAEAGVHQALAQLSSHYYDANGQAFNTSSPFAPAWFTGAPASQQSPTSTAACGAGTSCMSWSVRSCAFVVAVAGCGPLTPAGIRKGTVVLSGSGSVPNPTGGAPSTRTVTVNVDVQQPPQLVPTPSYWKEIYAGAPPSSGCDLSLGQGVSITAPIYVGGNLCLTSSSKIAGSGVDLRVLGWAWSQQQSGVGTTTPVHSAQIGGGCSSSNNTQPTTTSGCVVNKSGGNFWDTTPAGEHAPIVPGVDPLPAVDWTAVQDGQANSLPAPSCTNGRSLTETTFQLTPSASYSCTSAAGSIAYTYNPSGTSTLALNGTVYLSGNLSIDTQNRLVQYRGIGSLFIGGSVTAANNSFLCVAVAAGTCDFANATTSGSSGYWDATQNLLLVHSRGAFVGTNLRFQGGLYSATSVSLTGGQGCTQGPIVTPQTLIVGQQLNGTFPVFPEIQSGSLGTPPPPYTLGRPYGGSY
jgi:Tfp pilus assembly protein PilX